MLAASNPGSCSRLNPRSNPIRTYTEGWLLKNQRGKSIDQTLCRRFFVSDGFNVHCFSDQHKLARRGGFDLRNVSDLRADSVSLTMSLTEDADSRKITKWVRIGFDDGLHTSNERWLIMWASAVGPQAVHESAAAFRNEWLVQRYNDEHYPQPGLVGSHAQATTMTPRAPSMMPPPPADRVVTAPGWAPASPSIAESPRWGPKLLTVDVDDADSAEREDWDTPPESEAGNGCRALDFGTPDSRNGTGDAAFAGRQLALVPSPFGFVRAPAPPAQPGSPGCTPLKLSMSEESRAPL
jgi:hypothetical protein